MTYRVQADLSFINKEDADAFINIVDGMKSLLYVPTIQEMENRELFPVSRISLIKDYDDEGEKKCGENQISIQLVSPREV